MKKTMTIFLAVLLALLMIPFALIGCSKKSGAEGTGADVNTSDSAENTTSVATDITDDNEVETVQVDSVQYNYQLVSSDVDNGVYTYREETSGEEASVTVKCVSGTAGAYTVSGNTITFSGITEDSEYSLSGIFYGNITADGTGSEEYEFTLSLKGLTLTSYTECPISITGFDKAAISANKSTENVVVDSRAAAGDDEISAAIFADCDLDVKGKGTLKVSSVSNNGIHTKDDLEVKNLTLQVECVDNALKGNDSVTVLSGNITLIARQGDGIKTSNSDVSSKGNQRGTISLQGGTILIYAACDGLDAAYNVELNEESGTLDLQIFTDKYSPYSEEVTEVSTAYYYVRYNSTSYKYSVYYYNDGEEGVWKNSAASETEDRYRYFPIEKPSGYAKMILYIYTDTQAAGQSEDYAAASGAISVNENYDTIALTYRNGSLQMNWTNRSFGGGMMGDGNSNKGSYSTKGIKADNEIVIAAGSVTVKSYDDAIHANNDETLENGVAPLGNITISGGTLTLYSDDDGIHADGVTSISGGTVRVIHAYEGIEGNTVEISGGDVSVVSTDDGVNATATAGVGITVSGGTLYVFAKGDGLDSNSQTYNQGIVFSGGKTVVISNSNGNSSIDTERGYTYTGGLVLAIGSAGGMGNEAQNCSALATAGGTANVSASAGSYVVLDGAVSVKMPISMNASVVYLGYTGSVTTATSTTLTHNANGVAFIE